MEAENGAKGTEIVYSSVDILPNARKLNSLQFSIGGPGGHSINQSNKECTGVKATALL